MRRLAPLLWVGMAAVVACGSHPPNRLVLHFDASAGGDGGTTDAATDDSGDDGGAVDPTLGGPCVDDAQCDDSIACTYDSCDGSVGRCRNVPDDAQCDDGVFCDGKERCVLRHGCQPGPVETCEDGNECTIDTCVEATKSCSNTPRDEDGDGDPDAHCVPHRDCNDLDPTVSSQHAEVCANGKDDNCNGQVDEQPCVTAPGDGCMTTVPLGGPGTYALSTLGCDKTFTTSCSVSKPQAASDVVSSVVVPPGPNVDLEVWATSSVEVAVAIDASCGQASSELACGSGPGATSVRARARNVAPGTYFVVATTASQTSDVTLAVQFLTPSSPPTNVDCASAIPLAPNTPTTVSIVDPPTRLASACPASTGALTYSLALSAPSDVTLYASTLRGSGTAVLGLRVPHCTDMGDELRCSAGDAPSLYARALAPGTYVVTVAATSPIDVSVQAALSPPTPAPPDQTCSGSPSLGPGGSLAFDLAAHEGDIRDGCATGGPDAAYDLALPSASD
ncbi:MAG TPA: putative metal-binding motif-containing protein, partial [Polyangiaceae bacterium]|nr:putative metal-binding motif-containing protein [Polyangiaceae bacterium]